MVSFLPSHDLAAPRFEPGTAELGSLHQSYRVSPSREAPFRETALPLFLSPPFSCFYVTSKQENQGYRKMQLKFFFPFYAKP